MVYMTLIYEGGGGEGGRGDKGELVPSLLARTSLHVVSIPDPHVQLTGCSIFQVISRPLNIM